MLSFPLEPEQHQTGLCTYITLAGNQSLVSFGNNYNRLEPYLQSATLLSLKLLIRNARPKKVVTCLAVSSFSTLADRERC